MFETVRQWFRKTFSGAPQDGRGNVSESMTLTLTRPIRAGSEIRARTSNPALAITDDMGNTYQRLTIEEWKAIAQKSGPLTVTADWPTNEGNQLVVQEWR
jgi:hypothetical protein